MWEYEGRVEPECVLRRVKVEGQNFWRMQE
jgi:hypothetical protein